ncbi:hypothetical protein DL766_010461 [Monosporascus sp. MC13-8B]|uniref:Uncharacterized protein n=1 Tax=Monosporascus cannonballus TaxID=155416 RepID=A0ABY0GX59_9PEZI|nr:hypothetical protein DL762_008112 [Monosporascus cannonballus]RYP01815.1 hypothetical protein DL766_010461 [Monosporascus sp. MC13-8B]
MPPFRATQQAEAVAFTRLNMGKVIKAAEDSCPLLMRIPVPTAVTAYDNFEQMEHVKEQRVDNENSFRSITTVSIPRYLVSEATKSAFPDCIIHVKSSNASDRYPTKTEYESCLSRPIPHDKSTNVGNLNVLANIFEEQYKLPEDAFQERLFLIYGDQKTT